MRSSFLRQLIPLILVVLVIPACGDSSDEATDTTLTPTTTNTVSTTTPTTAAPTTTTTVPVQGSGPYVVATTVVSHPATQDIWVTAPGDADADAWGTWPIVFATHGRGGSGDGLAATAAELASYGAVVFAPTYRSTEGQYIEQDLECAYRYSMSIAEDYGADLDQPVTSFGHSLGASMVLVGGLGEAAYGPGGTYDACFAGVPRSDVIVAVAGCHYQYEGEQFPFDLTGFSNMDADVVLVAGTDDDVCELWQSQDATEALQAAGYDARLVEIDGGNHANVVFYEIVDGEWLLRPGDPVGEEVAQVVLDAINAAQ
jgi:acetyl esterase/lipase